MEDVSTLWSSTEDDQDHGPAARRRILGAQLRHLREAAGISQNDAAEAIRASASKICRMELGKVRIKLTDVRDLLELYGVEQGARQYLGELCGEANEHGWWNSYSDSIPSWFRLYVGLEEAASVIVAYEVQFVPGLLQTAEYAAAIMSQGRPAMITEAARRRVALRMRRQRLLEGPNPPRVWIVIDEAVLRRLIGGQAVMRAQIEHLMMMAQQPHITLQVVPNQMSGYAAEGAFSMLRFPDPELPNVVYIEHLTGALHIDRPEDVEEYRRVFDRLTVNAETPKMTMEILAKIYCELWGPISRFGYDWSSTA